jgi:hypothetical protein
MARWEERIPYRTNKSILTDKDVSYPYGGWVNGLGLLCLNIYKIYSYLNIYLQVVYCYINITYKLINDPLMLH